MVNYFINFLCYSGRGFHASTWDGESGHRIHVSDLAVGVSRKEIERAFSKYGDINEVFLICFYFHII